MLGYSAAEVRKTSKGERNPLWDMPPNMEADLGTGRLRMLVPRNALGRGRSWTPPTMNLKTSRGALDVVEKVKSRRPVSTACIGSSTCGKPIAGPQTSRGRIAKLAVASRFSTHGLPVRMLFSRPTLGPRDGAASPTHSGGWLRGSAGSAAGQRDANGRVRGRTILGSSLGVGWLLVTAGYTLGGHEIYRRRTS